MRRFIDLTDCEFMSETTDGKYCLFVEAQAEIERLQATLLRVENALAYSAVEVPIRVVERVRQALKDDKAAEVAGGKECGRLPNI